MAKFLGLGRPTMEQVLEDELYNTERLLVQAKAKLSHARTISGQHEVTVRELEIQCNQIRADIVRRVPPAKDPNIGEDFGPGFRA